MGIGLKKEYEQLRALRLGISRGETRPLLKLRIGCTEERLDQLFALYRSHTGDAEQTFMRLLSLMDVVLENQRTLYARTSRRKVPATNEDGNPLVDEAGEQLMARNPELNLGLARLALRDQAATAKQVMDTLHDLGMLKLMKERLEGQHDYIATEVARRVWAELVKQPLPTLAIPAVEAPPEMARIGLIHEDLPEEDAGDAGDAGDDPAGEE